MSTTSESLEEIAALRDFAASLHSNTDLINEEREAAKTIRAAAARLSELERENARLCRALEPFANVAAHDIGDDETDRDAFRPFSNPKWAAAPLLTVGDLRRARAALAGSEKP
jgi:hypothetical protein